MTEIDGPKVGALVRYHFTKDDHIDGKIVGRRVNGCVEGDFGSEGYLYAVGDGPDRVKVAFPTIGVPPETISITCSPDAVECID
jgi:hypothetical protein